MFTVRFLHERVLDADRPELAGSFAVPGSVGRVVRSVEPFAFSAQPWHAASGARS
jgi:hypothetical protein